jgi:hypothetical protein
MSHEIVKSIEQLRIFKGNRMDLAEAPVDSMLKRSSLLAGYQPLCKAIG